MRTRNSRFRPIGNLICGTRSNSADLVLGFVIPRGISTVLLNLRRLSYAPVPAHLQQQLPREVLMVTSIPVMMQMTETVRALDSKGYSANVNRRE